MVSKQTDVNSEESDPKNYHYDKDVKFEEPDTDEYYHVDFEGIHYYDEEEAHAREA